MRSFIKKKKINFFLYSNNIEFYLYYLKIFYSKDVMLLLNENINFKYLQELITKYKPDFIVHPYRKEQRNFTNYTLSFYTKYYTFLKINKSYDHNLFKDLSTLLTTSASTGSKKFVRISYENIYENSKSIIKYLKIKSSDKLITTLPVDYTYGFSQLNTHLIQNASIIINKYSLLQKNFGIYYKKVKQLLLEVYHLVLKFLKKLKSEKLNFYNVKNITQAGGKLNEDLQIYFSNVFKKKN